MTLPAPRSGRTFLIVNAAAAGALLAGTLLAQAPQPSSGAATPAAGETATKKAPAAQGAAKTAAGSSGAAKAPASEKSSVSYSLGVSMGEQLHGAGVSAEAVSSERLAQGVRDGLSGKAKMTDADREKINKLVRSAYEAAGETNHRAAAKFLAENGKKADVVTTASGLEYKVVTAGSGEAPKATDEVTVNYRGTLLDGTEFDSSYTRGQPASFAVNKVIPGWTEALQLMKPGAKYQLFVPPQLAYDLRARPGIPPGSMLIFDVELLGIKAPQSSATPASPETPSPTPAAGQPPPN
jgi:FKBP-type peptidyl-prolyl cis-trans isomerase